MLDGKSTLWTHRRSDMYGSFANLVFLSTDTDRTPLPRSRSSQSETLACCPPLLVSSEATNRDVVGISANFAHQHKCLNGTSVYSNRSLHLIPTNRGISDRQTHHARVRVNQDK